MLQLEACFPFSQGSIRFSRSLQRKKTVKHFTVDFIFEVMVKRVNYGSPLRQLKYQAQQHRYLSLMFRLLCILPATQYCKGLSGSLTSIQSKGKMKFFLLL